MGIWYGDYDYPFSPSAFQQGKSLFLQNSIIHQLDAYLEVPLVNTLRDLLE